MIQTRRILFNAFAAILQVVGNSLVLLLLYGYLLKIIGPDHFGIWTTVFAISAISRVADMGLSGGVTKFVAKYGSLDRAGDASKVVETAFLAIALLTGVLICGLYPLADLVLSHTIPAASIHQAKRLLPFSMLALWLSALGSVAQAGLDGLQRVDVRSYLTLGASLMFGLLCIVCVPRYGLLGLAVAQVIQAFVLVLATWLTLRLCLPSLPLLPYRWHHRVFKEMVRYGSAFQVISISALAYDAATKALLAKFGGLTLTAHFELATKAISMIRGLLVAANQVLVPTFAGLHERDPAKVGPLFNESFRILLYLSLPAFTFVVALAPALSWVWLGKLEGDFVLCLTILSVGYFLNVLSCPAYFAYLGIGDLGWNTVTHVVMGVLNILGGHLLGRAWGGFGVVVAWSFALGVGSAMILLSYCVKYKVKPYELVDFETVLIALSSALALCVGLHVSEAVRGPAVPLRVVAVVATLFAIMFLPFFLHPTRHRLVSVLVRSLRARQLKDF